MRMNLPSNAVVIAAIALTFTACSSDKQTQAPARAPVFGNNVGMTNMQRETDVPNTSTASNVSLSPDILRACDIANRNAYFAFDSSNLAAFDRGPLDDVATCFTRGPMSGRKLELVGHTDPRGTTDYNLALGQARAQAVGDYLISQGVSPANVPSTSRGAMDATGRDETGWAHDRRVDVLLGK
jgi:peptidoglycan-associated lipoprotein